ncbi:hypothetical protein ONZ45_g4672 [Pleurotus djamor]|nr:hypothetical protein ONZ45_g4661 [Pleurotus djamor]KAJ8518240.1 hypothetical protein ONZ45_g4672 [Pleurotus djamor]
MPKITSRLRSNGSAVSYGSISDSGEYEDYDPEQVSLQTQCHRSKLWDLLNSEVDTEEVAGPLAAYCFMTGLLDAVTFSAISVWCGFQTGNFVQLTLSLARILDPESAQNVPRRPDQQALCSLLSFNFGAFLGRIGDHIGTATRKWLIIGTLIQTLFTMGASIAVWKINQAINNPSQHSLIEETFGWTDIHTFLCVGFVSASLGLQGIIARRLNTQFAATIVLTTVWIELMADPSLFHCHRKSVSRDHKLIFLGSIFLGALSGWYMIHTIGSAGALAVATVVRFFVSFTWLLVPGNEGQK